MPHIRSEIRAIVSRTLDECGAINVRFEHTGGGHQRVRFRFGKRQHSYVFASTTRCRRTHQNCRAALRRMCRRQPAELRGE